MEESKSLPDTQQPVTELWPGGQGKSLIWKDQQQGVITCKDEQFPGSFYLSADLRSGANQPPERLSLKVNGMPIVPRGPSLAFTYGDAVQIPVHIVLPPHAVSNIKQQIESIVNERFNTVEAHYVIEAEKRISQAQVGQVPKDIGHLLVRPHFAFISNSAIKTSIQQSQPINWSKRLTCSAFPVVTLKNAIVPEVSLTGSSFKREYFSLHPERDSSSGITLVSINTPSFSQFRTFGANTRATPPSFFCLVAMSDNKLNITFYRREPNRDLILQKVSQLKESGQEDYGMAFFNDSFNQALYPECVFFKHCLECPPEPSLASTLTEEPLPQQDPIQETHTLSRTSLRALNELPASTASTATHSGGVGWIIVSLMGELLGIYLSFQWGLDQWHVISVPLLVVGITLCVVSLLGVVYGVLKLRHHSSIEILSVDPADGLSARDSQYRLTTRATSNPQSYTETKTVAPKALASKKDNLIKSASP